MTGCGKSTLCRELMQGRERVIVVEPFSKNSYATMRARDLRELRELLGHRPRRFWLSVFVDNPADFARLCALAWAVAPVTLLLDETSMYLPNPFEVPTEFKRICQVGRHAGPDELQPVSVLAIGQRPVNLPPVFRAEVEHWYLFRLNSHADRKLLENDMGLPREIADSAGQLAPHKYMKVDRFGGVSYGETTP
jgi:hypothetical protein